MNILAFDTSSPACSVALYSEKNSPDGQLYAMHEIAPMQHTSIILPMMQSILDSAGLTLAELDAIAFGCGPGSFTGIRIAASLAQGLAYANDLPVIPVSSLAATAQAAYMSRGWDRLITAVDARMGQIYWDAYRVENNAVIAVFPEELVTPDAAHAIPEGEWYAVGDAWKVYAVELASRIGQQPRQVDAECVPTAEAVLCLAKDRFQRGDWVDAADALPVYLR